MKKKSFFSETDAKRISATIAEVESRTAGEVVVVTTDRSDTYPEARILAGVLLGVLASLIATDAFFSASLWFFVPAAMVLSVLLGWGVRFVPAAMRPFIAPSRSDDLVSRAALAAFYEKGLHKTRDNTGVLFYLSLLEHKVWVLADKGIYEKMLPETLQGYATEVARGIKTGHAAEALCGQIQAVGRELARHFPARPDDFNELPDEVIHD